MNHDALTQTIRALQMEGFTLPLYDADRRTAWLANCANTLKAIPDPEARASQAMNFAIGLVVQGVASDVALRYIQKETSHD